MVTGGLFILVSARTAQLAENSCCRLELLYYTPCIDNSITLRGKSEKDNVNRSLHIVSTLVNVITKWTERHRILHVYSFHNFVFRI